MKEKKQSFRLIISKEEEKKLPSQTPDFQQPTEIGQQPIFRRRFLPPVVLRDLRFSLSDPSAECAPDSAVC